MIYHAYQVNLDLMEPFRHGAAMGLSWIQGYWRKLTPAERGSTIEALLDLIATMGTTHERPDFGIKTVRVSNHLVPVREEVIADASFGSLLHFAKPVRVVEPRVLSAGSVAL